MRFPEKIVVEINETLAAEWFEDPRRELVIEFQLLQTLRTQAIHLLGIVPVVEPQEFLVELKSTLVALADTFHHHATRFQGEQPALGEGR